MTKAEREDLCRVVQATDLEARLDAWIAKQGDAPSKPEAIRRLVELGLSADSKRGQADAVHPENSAPLH
jgi:hypothetical protein